jgi:hypothetical protein
LFLKQTAAAAVAAMGEPPASWDQQDDATATLSSITAKLPFLNVNAMEFVPSFGASPSASSSSKAASLPAAATSKMSSFASVVQPPSSDHQQKPPSSNQVIQAADSSPTVTSVATNERDRQPETEDMTLDAAGDLVDDDIGP